MHNKVRLGYSDQGETTVTSISEATADPLHNTHILIVDNELGMRRYLVSTLRSFCRGVDSIETAQAAEVAALTSIPVPTASPKRPNISPEKMVRMADQRIAAQTFAPTWRTVLVGSKHRSASARTAVYSILEWRLFAFVGIVVQPQRFSASRPPRIRAHHSYTTGRRSNSGLPGVIQ